MNPYCEKVIMPDEQFRIKSFSSSSFEHVIAVHPHWHEEVEILHVISGQAMQQVNNYFFPIVPGDLVIIGSEQLHSTYSYEGLACELDVFMFNAASLLEAPKTGFGIKEVSAFDNSVIFKNPIKTSEANELLNCLLDIKSELEQKPTAFAYLVKSHLYKVAGILERNHLYNVSQVDNDRTHLTRQLLTKSFELIDHYYTEEIDLKKAADASNLSVPHFCRLFKKAAGMTFNDYLAFYRVNHSEKLLRSNMKIADVAMDCGFGSVTSFIRNFKKYKNCTPSDYKNRY